MTKSPNDHHKSGRPPEPPSGNYYRTAEAAEILDRSTETVRSWIRQGRLEGVKYITHKGETRYHATKASVEAEARRLHSVPTTGGIERTLQNESAAAVSEVIETVTREVRENRRVMVETCDRIIEYVEAYKHEVLELAEQEQGHQAESLEIQRQTLELLRGVQRTEEERAEHGLRERRSFWRRLLS